MMEHLDGGRNNIYRFEDSIFRPADIWTEDVHKFLRYLHNEGFDCVPLPLNIDKTGVEELTFVEGSVFNGQLPDYVRSDQMLLSLCRLIRKFHDIGQGYIKNLTHKEQWMLSVASPIETMIHGDLGPYNIVIRDKEAYGIIDFDTLHPGSRLWDLSYALYRWIPLMGEDNPENFGSKEDKQRRLDLFMTTYGLASINQVDVIESVVKRVSYLTNFMISEADRDNMAFKQNIKDGHLKQYFKDIEYLKNEWLSD